ncbi:MAG: beta-galactosidase [Armatimonadota bacterium]
MRLDRMLLAGLATVALSLRAGAVTLVLQAEEFACETAAWVAREQTDRYAPDSRLRHLWGASGGVGLATHEVTIPEAGPYIIWVRHTVMAGDERGYNRGAFALSIRRGEDTLAEGRFDEEPPDHAPERVHEYRWSRFEADLPAGEVRLELSKLEPVNCSGWTRYVDVIVLTTDPQYEPDVADFQPKTWLRVTLGPTQTPPIYIHCFADHFRAPWYKHFSLSADGYEERVAPSRGPAAFLTAGQATPWCDITPAVHEDTGARLELRGAERYSYDEWLPALDATFDFATAPGDDAIVRSFHRQGPGAGLVVITPGVLSAETADQLVCDRDFVERNVALAATIPEVTFGSRPTLFPFLLSMGLRAGLFAPDIREAEYRIAARMGFNGSYDRPDEMMRALGFLAARTGTTSWYMDNDCYLQPQTERIRERIAQTAAGWEEPPTVVMFMDEPGAKPLEHAASCEVCAQAFRAWLRDELRVPLAELGAPTWDEVTPVTADARETAPALYYWSQRFRAKAFADFLRLQTDEISAAFPGAPPATVNFSDGAVYSANMYSQGADYFRIFGTRALTMAWSEDWSNIASTYQCCGYNVDLLRAATREQGQPIGMYVITSYGHTPLDAKLKAYSSLGRGARVLHSFAYGPHYAGHEPNWYLRAEMYHPMTELCREIGGAEDLLMQAERMPAEVAFLYSTTSDIWTVGANDLYGHDRMHSYLALIHAQVPVDFLSEEQVAGGALAGYKALYVFGPNLHSTAAGPIAEWVHAGGVLYLAGGAAVADEYNRPARPLDEALDLQRGAVEVLHTHVGPGRHLANLEVAGSARFRETALGLFGVRQGVSGGETLAQFGDGAPALVQVPAGEGTVFACGMLPGISHIHAALAQREALGSPEPREGDAMDLTLAGSFAHLGPQELSYNPWEYPAAERELLLLAAEQARARRPVTLSRPLVEAFYLEGARGAVVTLANYSLQPTDALAVTVRVPRLPARVQSVRQGELAFEADGGVVRTVVPLLDTDMLKIYW